MIIEINIFIKKIINILVPSKKLRISLRKKSDDIFIPLGLKNYINKIETKYKNSWLFVPFWPWGDFIICCSLLKQYKDENGGEIVIFYTNHNQLEMIKSFNFADKTEKISPELYYALGYQNPYLPIHNKYRLSKGKLYEMSHIVFNEAQNNKSFNFVEVYSKQLNIITQKLEKPHISEKIKNKVDCYYKQITKNQKVIMISPEAKSYDKTEISNEFWLNIAHKLSNQGYKIIFNSNNNTYNEYTQVYLPILEQVYLSTICYANISLRSGYTDLITVFGAENQIILYPNSGRFITVTEEEQYKEMNKCFNYDNTKSLSENMYTFTSINNMYKKNFLELTVHNEQKAVNEIIKYLSIDKCKL